jgi:hypothetical protein
MVSASSNTFRQGESPAAIEQNTQTMLVIALSNPKLFDPSQMPDWAIWNDSLAHVEFELHVLKFFIPMFPIIPMVYVSSS